MTAVVKKWYFSYFLRFRSCSDDFLVATLNEIFEQKKVKGSASKANKDCQTLLFNVHVVHRTPKVSFPPQITEDDGEHLSGWAGCYRDLGKMG